MTAAVEFRIDAREGLARAGGVRIRGRTFGTPAFMPVGTLASVKALAPDDLLEARVEIILANTYHLRIRPGHRVVREFGGLHRFAAWDGAILTDSGGYQIFSHAGRVEIDEQGATFRSHLDGALIRLTPEEAIEIQAALDPDIAMVLDQPIALPARRDQIEVAAARTLRWARRSREHHRAQVQSGQALFGILQGALDLELRAKQAEALRELSFDGYALGGLAVGESKREFQATLEAVLPLLPEDRPRYVMGVGYPEDLLLAIGCGADMFDCVLPTRHARTGQAFTSRGVVRLRLSANRLARGPLDPNCACTTCRGFELGYLTHLFTCHEMLGPILVARHNVYFYQQLVRDAAFAIRRGRFAAHREATLRALEGGDSGT